MDPSQSFLQAFKMMADLNHQKWLRAQARRSAKEARLTAQDEAEEKAQLRELGLYEKMVGGTPSMDRLRSFRNLTSPGPTSPELEAARARHRAAAAAAGSAMAKKLMAKKPKEGSDERDSGPSPVGTWGLSMDQAERAAKAAADTMPVRFLPKVDEVIQSLGPSAIEAFMGGGADRDTASARMRAYVTRVMAEHPRMERLKRKRYGDPLYSQETMEAIDRREGTAPFRGVHMGGRDRKQQQQYERNTDYLAALALEGTPESDALLSQRLVELRGFYNPTKFANALMARQTLSRRDDVNRAEVSAAQTQLEEQLKSIERKYFSDQIRDLGPGVLRMSAVEKQTAYQEEVQAATEAYARKIADLVGQRPMTRAARSPDRIDLDLEGQKIGLLPSEIAEVEKRARSLGEGWENRAAALLRIAEYRRALDSGALNPEQRKKAQQFLDLWTQQLRVLENEARTGGMLMGE